MSAPTPARDLWDQPGNVYSDVEARYDLPAWSYTERVVECLVAAADLIGRPPLRSGGLAAYAEDLLLEAEHLLSQELLNGSDQAGPAVIEHLQRVRVMLSRARAVVASRPGTAAALAVDVLAQLDRLAAARAET